MKDGSRSGPGFGYAIALKDLELRGAGNLLGAEQSGFVQQVGLGKSGHVDERGPDQCQHAGPPQAIPPPTEDERRQLEANRRRARSGRRPRHR